MTAGQGQRLYSGVGFFNWRHLSPPPQVHLFQMVRVPLELRGLTYMLVKAEVRFAIILGRPYTAL